MRLHKLSLSLLLVSSLAAGLPACASSSETSGGLPPGQTLVEREELKQRIKEIPFQHGIELVANLERLSMMDEHAVPALTTALRSENWRTRASIAWVLGARGDRQVIPDLREATNDRVAAVRYEAASSLIELGDSAGFAVLVEGLEEGDLRERFKCIEALRGATARDFGYRHDGSASERRAAVQRWQEWLRGVDASAL